MRSAFLPPRLVRLASWGLVWLVGGLAAGLSLSAMAQPTEARKEAALKADLHTSTRPALSAPAAKSALRAIRDILDQGFTDASGEADYNEKLGEARAEAVRRSLSLLGVADSQVEAVSFGKEKPAVPGGDEAAWAKNRRAEIKDR